MSTYLELGFAHGAVKSVLERLVLEVEFDIVLIGAIADCDVKIDLDGTLGNGSKFVWLGELDVVPAKESQLANCRYIFLYRIVATYCKTLPYSWPKNTWLM